jgi:hypothetical protein
MVLEQQIASFATKIPNHPPQAAVNVIYVWLVKKVMLAVLNVSNVKREKQVLERTVHVNCVQLGSTELVPCLL